MWEHHHLIYMARLRVARTSSKLRDVRTCHRFVRCKLEIRDSQFCTKTHLDQLFHLVNASSLAAQREGHATATTARRSS